MTTDDLLCALAETLWISNISPTIAGTEARRWMRNPRPGDMVYIHFARGKHDERVGRLLAVTEVPCFDEWDPADGPEPVQPGWVIVLRDGRVAKWTNVKALRIPEAPHCGLRWWTE